MVGGACGVGWEVAKASKNCSEKPPREYIDSHQNNTVTQLQLHN